MAAVIHSTNTDPLVLSHALDHLAQLISKGREIEYSDAVQTWYRSGYRCSAVPEPKDADPTRLALKACIVERLVEVLNTPPHSDDQSVPDWCARITSIHRPIPLQSPRLLEGEAFNSIFAKRNFQVTKNFMYFV